MAERTDCPTCDGQKVAPCDCPRCSTREGRAYGVMGHMDRVCEDCDENGLVCGYCGEATCDCHEAEVAA